MSEWPQIPQGRPFLAFTRKYGWVVATAASEYQRDRLRWVAQTRPRVAGLKLRDVLVVADLPPVPDAAL